MTVPASLISTLVRLGADALDGLSPAEVARAMMAIGVELLPVDELRKHLDEAAVKRADAIADAAEAAKFGG